MATPPPYFMSTLRAFGFSDQPDPKFSNEKTHTKKQKAKMKQKTKTQQKTKAQQKTRPKVDTKQKMKPKAAVKR